MNNVLDLFKNVTVDHKNLLSVQDEQFGKDVEKAYSEKISTLSGILDTLKKSANPVIYPASYNGYKYTFDYMNLIGTTEKEIAITLESFVGAVTSYFRNEYNVSVKADGRETSRFVDENAAHPENVNFDIIFEKFVFEKLGGLNFKEKAIKEIKDNCRANFQYNKGEIKKNTIEVSSFFWIDSFLHQYYNQAEIRYDSKVRLYDLMNAIALFDESAEANITWFKSAVNNGKNEAIIRVHDLGDKILSIRLFKNGKIILKFNTFENCRRFYEEYCTYRKENR